MDIDGKRIAKIEAYFNTDNSHWNEYAFNLFNQTVKRGDFIDPELPLSLLSAAVDTVTDLYKAPLKACQQVIRSIDKPDMNPSQRLFITKWVIKYLNESDFENADTFEIQKLLESHSATLKAKAPDTSKPLSGNIRESLKRIVLLEIERLPESLDSLEPQQRLNVLCKLIPFILPRVQQVHLDYGEPSNFDFGGNMW